MSRFGHLMELRTFCSRYQQEFSILIIEKEMEMKQCKNHELAFARDGWWFSLYEWPEQPTAILWSPIPSLAGSFWQFFRIL